MKKNIFLLLLTLFSFSAIHAETGWKLENGTLTISGTGNMPDYDNVWDIPWYSNYEKINSIVIEDGVTSIGHSAFEGCSSLTSVTIPNSVTSIGSVAFAHCTALTSITIPNSVMSIGVNAFSGCSGLISITIPNSVTSIGRLAFSGCSGLTSVTIGNSVTSIGTYTFEGCSGLTSVTIGNSVTNIDTYAFCGCSSLTSVTIPNSVTSIGTYAFYECSSLTSITFKGITHPKFGIYVFGDVNRSISIYVPSKSIEAYKNALSGQFNNGYNVNIQAIPPVILSDDEAYTQDSQLEDVDVFYTRNFSTNWEALYLPFSLSYDDWKDDFEIAYISAVRQEDIDDDGIIDKTVLEFVKMTGGSTAPNTPYIIRAKKKGEKTFYVENTTVYPAEKNTVDCSTTAANFIFTGTYIPARFLASRPYYTLSGGKLERLDGLNGPSVPPYHWYMKIESRNSGYAKYYNPAKEITISVLGEEEATGVEELRIMNYELPDDKLPVYDLNGRKVNENSLKPGIYVKNGKKFVIK